MLALLVGGGGDRAQGATERPTDELTRTIHRRISEHLGAALGEITADTDLVRDLGADPMTAFELLALICDEQDVALPADPGLTRVGDIVDYVRAAPAEEPLIIFRGIDAKKEEIQVQRVLFATDRNLQRSAGGGREPTFGPDRSAQGRIHYGVCEVTIPVTVHRKGKLERPAWWRFELSEDPKKHIVLRRIESLGEAEFLALVDSTLAESEHNPQGDVLIFVHGFNVTFAAAARRTAQMAYDLEFAGLPMFFSWPADGKIAAYLSDREDVEWAVLHLEKFLLDLKERTQAGRIHLIAHSMGNQAVIRTLYSLAQRRGDGQPLFENVVMAAPDFDAHRFVEQIAPRVVPLANRWTLYASEKDFALDISTALAAKRLGLPLAVAQGVDTIDASGIDVAPWSVPETHGYFSSKQRVIRDLRSVLAGIAPAQRDLLRRVLDGRPYWALRPLAP